jgi:hypothetical protein
MSHDWQSTKPHDSHGSVNPARDAAEALFKPKVQATVTSSDDAPASEPEVPRQPRIFTITPASVIAEERSEAVATQKKARRTSSTRQARTVTRCDHGRIRALVRYGMTPEQVADVYGVSLKQIEQIVASTIVPSDHRV